MTESKSMILGCAGKSLTREEINFYRNECPWGFILFARNIAETEQIRDLVAAMRDCIERPDAPV
ncbi:MAG: beta-hexosaminidase, partial [Mesorhizobium sp.]